MDARFDFGDVDVKEDIDMPETPTCRVDGCSNPVAPYGGKGPRPKVCVEHKRKPATGTRTRKQKSGTDYREAISGMLQLPAGVLAFVGSQTDKQGRLTHPEYLADASAITQYAPPIAEALNDLANDQPQVAAILDRVLKVGPYGAILSAVLPMAAQILANHKVIPAGVMGAKSLEEQFTVVSEAPDAG